VTTADPLYYAAEYARLDVLRCLVKDLHADVNGANVSGFTPLYIAAHLSNMDLLLCLVRELGADVNQATRDDGCTPLHAAARNAMSSERIWC
jgi:ankyrin repeat protein